MCMPTIRVPFVPGGILHKAVGLPPAHEEAERNVVAKRAVRGSHLCFPFAFPVLVSSCQWVAHVNVGSPFVHAMQSRAERRMCTLDTETS